RQQIAQRILAPVQPEDRQSGGGRAIPITVRVVADVQDLVRRQPNELQRAPVDLGMWFVRAELARDKNVAEKFRDAEVFEDEAQPPIEVGDNGELRPGM